MSDLHFVLSGISNELNSNDLEPKTTNNQDKQLCIIIKIDLEIRLKTSSLEIDGPFILKYFNFLLRKSKAQV